MIYIGKGLGLLVLGFCHILFPISSWEVRILQALQKHTRNNPGSGLFKEIWFFGRTTFAVTVLIGLTGYDWRLGLPALIVFGLVVGLESLLKALVKRRRPFRDHLEIAMEQPLEPSDPSFPSGDALRVWFLTAILIKVVGGNPAFGIIALLLAGMVSLGRMALGVHYPTDVLAGTGLGLMGAGAVIWLWQALNLL